MKKRIEVFAIVSTVILLVGGGGCQVDTEKCANNDLCIPEASCVASTSLCERWESPLTLSISDDWQSATVNVPYEVWFEVSGGFPPYTWILNDGNTETYPQWLTLTGDGENSQRAKLHNKEGQLPDKPTVSGAIIPIKITVKDNTKQGNNIRLDNQGFSVSETLTVSDCERNSCFGSSLKLNQSECDSNTGVVRNCIADSNGCAQLEVTGTNDNASHCGTCNNKCTNDYGSTKCSSSACVPTCDTGYGDCDGNPKNGCEASLATFCNGHASSCSAQNICACSSAFAGDKCDQCAIGALGIYPDCFLPASTDYCLTNQCVPVTPTGQDKCYDTGGTLENPCPGSISKDCYDDSNVIVPFCGQDAQYTDRSRSYICLDKLGNTKDCATLADGDMVKDSLTNLIWQRYVIDSSETLAWQAAVDKCKSLKHSDGSAYGGQTDWRLANILELQSIVDYSRSSQSIDLTAFPSTPNDFFWSSSVDGTSVPRVMDFKSGGVSGDQTSKLHYFRCVRGGKTTITQGDGGRFKEDNKVITEPVVTDSITGLMWQEISVTGKTWVQALDYCQSSSYGGYYNWRLPNIKEMTSLLSFDPLPSGCKNCPATEFPALTYGWYVSSSSSAFNSPTYTYMAWVVDFKYAFVSYYNKTTNYWYVICVRGGH
jgi:hypothetical protein